MLKPLFKKYCTFIGVSYLLTPIEGLYKWLIMIFGLTTASDTFIKAMTQVLMTNIVKYAHIVHASTVDLLGAERAQ